MKREEIKKIFADATDEQVNAIMSINGADIEKVKNRAETAENELKQKQAEFDKITNELESLKQSKASAEEYKTQFEKLQADIKAEREKAEAEKAEAERNERINARFAAVIGDKKFTHEAIKADYLRKFGEAVADKINEGKSDGEIFHELTKDDSMAFENVKVQTIPGGKPMNDDLTGKAFAKMSYTEKAELFKSNPQLYEQMKGE